MGIADHMEAVMDSGQSWAERMRLPGITLAKVTNITDDQQLNRVKCLPICNATVEETDWCYVMSPMGGKECGQFFFPQVDDLVVLAFLDGDPQRPFVLGSFWNSEVKPPYPILEGKVYHYAIKTPGKTELLFYDEPEKQRVTLTLPSGTTIAVDDALQSVTVSDKEGENALKMDLKGGEITLMAKTKLTLSAGESSIVLEASGNITEKSSNTVSLEGATVSAKGSAKLSFQGAAVEVKADATLDLNASGPATLKGAMVQIN